MLEMTDRDIYVHWKTAKKRKYEVHVLAQLNGTTPKAIQEIIDRMAEQEGVEVTDREDNPVDKLEKQAERAEAETKEEQKMTMEERKAKKAAYMKKYVERKKAEKAAAEGVITVIPTKTEPDVKVDNNTDDGLIRKAIQYYSADLADAVMMQRERVEEEQEKLRQMEADLKRCQEILGYEIEAKEGE